MRHQSVMALTFIGLVSAVDFCPGVINGYGGGPDDNFCCVGGANPVNPCVGALKCTKSTTSTSRMAACATKIPVTASNYDELASSASSMYLDSNGQITATAGDSQPSSNAAETSTDGTGTTSNAAATTVASSSPSFSSFTNADGTPTGNALASSSTGAAPKAAATLFAPLVGGAMFFAAAQ